MTLRRGPRHARPAHPLRPDRHMPSHALSAFPSRPSQALMGVLGVLAVWVVSGASSSAPVVVAAGASSLPAAVASDAPRSSSTAAPLKYRGVNFTHEGFRGRGGGYGSPAARASLARARELGVNAVAIVPYTFQRDTAVAAPFRVPSGRGGESDERVTRVIRDAHARGLSVLLKPQIWVRRSWPGAIAMDTEDGWVRFFRYYGEWIQRYARLAQREGVEVLSVGVELQAASRRTAEWRALIAQVRAVYSGALVYAANWYDEFDRVEFWDALDYVGVDAYFPLSEDADASDAELAEGAERAAVRMAEVSARWHRPVLITEIGFGSTRAPWRMPHSSDGGAVASPEDQARAYRATTEALRNRRWLEGAFWWKWPSHGRVPSPEDRGFSPLGKPAEAVLGAWFGSGGRQP